MTQKTTERPKPDTKAAVAFLQTVYPEGPWCLTCIASRTRLNTQTFFPETLAQMTAWLEGYNGQRNIYWQVNPVVGKLEKKAKREQIRSLNWLHVDIDAKAGGGFTGRIRSVALLS